MIKDLLARAVRTTAIFTCYQSGRISGANRRASEKAIEGLSEYLRLNVLREVRPMGKLNMNGQSRSTMSMPASDRLWPTHLERLKIDVHLLDTFVHGNLRDVGRSC
jgi:hypothetical protein